MLPPTNSHSKKSKTSILTSKMPLFTYKKETADKEVQTIIQRRFCESIQLKPADEEKMFFSFLEHTPFKDIEDHSIKTINLPKATVNNTVIPESKLNLRDCLLLDDDALSEICVELRERMRKSGNVKLASFIDDGTQTSLHVEPHVLQSDAVANVTVNASTQTN